MYLAELTQYIQCVNLFLFVQFFLVSQTAPISDMSTPGIRIRHRHNNIPKAPCVETDNVHEIVQMLIDGLSLDMIPPEIHPKLIVPLSAKKTEVLVAGKIELARKIQSIIRQLNITFVKPDPIDVKNIVKPTTDSLTMSYLSRSLGTNKLPLISTMKYQDNDEERRLKYRADVKSSEEYWKHEVKHFNELRNEELEKLNSQHEGVMKKLMSRPTTRHATRPSSASLSLKEKEKLLISKKKFDAAKTVRERAENVEFIEMQEAIQREERNLKRKAELLRNKQDFEKLTLERTWDAKWKDLRSEMINEYSNKDTQLRTLRPASQNASRNLPIMSRTMPVGKLKFQSLLNDRLNYYF
ncbi:hypothetical protein TRFO_37273 [Tritrichomonas foetus]|uniref:Uncharacterized protein n=1 Tax=Tritrichomonas foetus TaxID=1144522 RepID=A0A1J4JH25_9EUKA|nr:hypothetical protein TRFO_37273 [Tritrichomonas foetus]|eukprot:OHS96564.1 hypothetical protein TRFO_37273 [Tritrichomonas foetus]